MLTTRLWMGTLLVLLVLGLLALDQYFAPWYPFLLLFVMFLAGVGCHEILHLLPTERRPPQLLAYSSVYAVLLANWPSHLGVGEADAWHWVLGTYVALLLSGFLQAMERYRPQPGEHLTRLALSMWMAAYLGLLPSFLVQMRWDPKGRGTVFLALTIFVPKCCDIGAYFAGRLLGRHKMTPLLSPKKTWEGAIGGLALAAATAAGLNAWQPVMPWSIAIAYGVVIGFAGMLGDLAESLIKRDCQHKDASQVVPGFGGVLDVIDSILFAAPVSYFWLRQNWWEVLGN